MLEEQKTGTKVYLSDKVVKSNEVQNATVTIVRNQIFGETRGNKSSKSVLGEPKSNICVESKIRRKLENLAGQIAPTEASSGRAYAGIGYKRIRVTTPRHNGKVERQHRTDEKRFYKRLRMYSLEDGRKQLKQYNRFSNTIPKVCLCYRAPNEVLKEYRETVKKARQI